MHTSSYSTLLLRNLQCTKHAYILCICVSKTDSYFYFLLSATNPLPPRPSNMRLSRVQLATAILAAGSASAFAPMSHLSGKVVPALKATSGDNGDSADSVPAFLRSAAATAALAAAIWSGPSAVVGLASNSDFLPEGITSSVVANAKEMASASGARVNKDPESLLRYGLPINNKEVRQLQPLIEDIRQDIGSKRKAAALDGVKKSKGFLKSKAGAMTKSCREESKCTSIIAAMTEDLGPLEAALSDSQDANRGSNQEREALDKAYVAQDQLQAKLTDLEEQMVPAGYATEVPSDYADLPQLKGRATVEMVLKKANGGPFDVEGTNFPEAKMKMIIDGYTGESLHLPPPLPMPFISFTILDISHSYIYFSFFKSTQCFSSCYEWKLC